MVARQSPKLEAGVRLPPPVPISVWRSLVAHLFWVQGVVGSNPATETIIGHKYCMEKCPECKTELGHNDFCPNCRVRR